MVKKILCLLLLLMLVPCAAMAENPMVVDDANLFNPYMVEDMEQIIRRIEAEYQMDVVILTTYDVPATYSDAVIQDYADMYFDNNGYGMGEDAAGFLYMIDMTNRAPCISTAGVMIDYITDGRLETLFNASYDYLATGDYDRAAIAVLNYLERFLQQGREEGSFRYDAETGRRLSGLYNALTGTETLVAVGMGIAVAAIMYASVSGSYNLKGSTYRYDRGANTSVRFTENNETFIRQSVNVMRHNTSSGGHGSSGGSSRGSSVHLSSGGRSHGGGVGRRF